MTSEGKQLSSVLSAALIAIGLIGSSVVLSRAGVQAFRIKHAENRVVVTGSATKRIKSDWVVWHAVVKSQAPEMAQAYKKLAGDVPELAAFVKSRGIDAKEVKISAASIQEIHPRDRAGHRGLLAGHRKGREGLA